MVFQHDDYIDQWICSWCNFAITKSLRMFLLTVPVKKVHITGQGVGWWWWGKWEEVFADYISAERSIEESVL